MGGVRKAPRARDRILGARLRAIRREQTNLSLEQAAKLAQWSASTMSRIETGKRHISPEDVATLATIYQLPIAQREELVEDARAGDSAGWWDRPLPGVPMEMGALASYEADAHRLTDWSATLVPGLLQTYEYAVALLLSGGIDPRDVELRWMARLRRQQILGTVDYTAYIAEAPLRTPFGGRVALKRQLQHLVAAGGRGIGIRIVREHIPCNAMIHSWLLLEFPNTTPVVNVEVMNGGFYLHDEEAENYLEILARLDKVALSAAASRSLLQRLAEEM
jgi:transcriptional regulator with XRE-family HTH domain